MIGRTISHYRILDKLGEGGMGVVYRAEDTRLKRHVALKFLPGHAVESREQRARFFQEAQAAAALDHPNICTVYEIDEAGGQPFIAMACLEGQSLKGKIEAGPLTLAETLDIAAQVAEGLEAAHHKDIVHRDIKPANIMFVGPEGRPRQVKIMDFGLAQLSGHTRLTQKGMAVGTPAYMSPEQAQGLPVDRRTDIWSLGVVIFEMVTGRTPFKGASDLAVINSILSNAPERVSGLRSGVPLELERVINRALAKPPEERYQHVDDLLVDVRDLRRNLDAPTTTTTVRPSSASVAVVPSVAVLPFVNLNRDEENEFFADGVTEEIISALSKLAQLRVVSRTSAFQFKGKTQDIREIGERLNVAMVIEGSVRRAGNRVRVTAQLVNISDGYQVWSERYDREMKDVFDIQDEISGSIVDALRIKLGGEQKDHLARRRTENLEAYDLYLKGVYYSSRFALQKSVECFEQAIAGDPQFAPAYAGLAMACGTAAFWGLGRAREAWPRAQAAAVRALELDDSLEEAHSARAWVYAVYESNWKEAERHYRRALELGPGNASIHMWYAGGFLLPMGRFDEATAAVGHARELDPLSAPIRTIAAWCFCHGRQYGRAAEESRKVLELDPAYIEAYLALGVSLALQGIHAEAAQALEQATRLAPGMPSALGLLGWTYGLWGKTAEAAEILRQLQDLSRRSEVSAAMHIAHVYLGLGHKQQAIDWTEKAYEERDAFVRFLKVAPPYDPLRSEPRFIALLKKAGLETG